eukprot:CAMPEP_0198735246 /NCGR_PEP_ID=MMETSP1475-20131203/58155_1 /TAXON_ID= ORGANISM="Unidentified sp., Strain CCMP1999" /NCGR_SAMPLE_ID=MMETSP1475 /ASSEMBLY_ACC=CAM_ASM_001111 /LENGTH=767 /DNA_ID=CAMNT_0044498867 /DNA_START=54 /DNA_END=2357 /DNA_ORIENTATION=-
MEGGRFVDDIYQHRDERYSGLIPRAVRQIFRILKNSSSEYSVRVSHLELYNEQVTDLLTNFEDAEKLRIYDDEKSGTFVSGLAELTVQDEEEVMQILERSARRRITAETEMNKFSSRSHSIFTITVHSKTASTADGDEMLKLGKLNLVDLAGSENIGRSGAINQRAREAGNINQSLLALGKVINALVDHHPHVPYRDSKLTRLLQESLGGKNKTCVIATIGPAASSLEETISTLEYAYRAKSIKNRPLVNSLLTKRELLSDYTRRIAKLEKELLVAREKSGVYLPLEHYNQTNAQIEALLHKIAYQEQTLKDRDDSLTKLTAEQDETLADLSETRSALRETQKHLRDTTSELETQTSRLRSAEQALRETKFLLSNHVTTEARMHLEGRALQVSLEESLTEIDSLHSKLQLMVQSDIGEEPAGILTSVRTAAFSLRQQTENAQMSIRHLRETVAKTIGEESAHLNALKHNHKKSAEMAVTFVEHTFARHRRCIEETSKSAQLFSEKACEEGRKFETSTVDSLTHALSSGVDDVVKMSTDEMVEVTKVLDRLDAASKSFGDNVDRNLTRTAKSLQTLSQDAQKNNRLEEASVTEFFDKTQKLNQESTITLQKMSGDTENNRNQLNVAIADTKQAVKQFTESESASSRIFENSYEKFVESLATERGTVSSQTSSILRQMRNDIETVLDDVRGQIRSLGDRSKNSSEQVALSCNAVSKHVGEFATDIFKVDTTSIPESSQRTSRNLEPITAVLSDEEILNVLSTKATGCGS